MYKSIVSIFLFLIFTRWVAAQDGRVLTLSEAVRIALENNISLKQQRNRQRISQAQKTAGLLSMAPDISAFAQAWRAQGNQFIEQEARVVNLPETSNLYGTVDVELPLFNGLNNLNTIRRADADLSAQRYLINRTRQDVIADVAGQYLQCLLDREFLTIAEEDLKNQTMQLRQITEMVFAGSRARPDEYGQQAIVKTAELAVLKARIALRRDKALLAQILAMDLRQSFSVKEPAWDTDDMAAFRDVDALYDNALGHRSDLLGARNNVESARRGLSVSQALFFPSLSAFASINSRYSDASEPSFNDQIEANRSTEYGLKLSIPVFSGMRNNVDYVRSKVGYDNAKLDLESAEIRVKAEVLTAYQNYKDAELSDEVAEAQLKAAELAYELEKERYRLGASDLINFTQAGQRYVQAKGDMARAAYTLLFQNILLLYTTGKLDEDDIPFVVISRD